MIPPNPFVLAIEPYRSGEQPEDSSAIKLNTNEFPYPAAPGVIEAIRRAATDTIRLYPNARCDRLRAKLARHHGVRPDQIFVGNGSDEILRLVIQAHAGPKRMTAMVEPTYSLYRTLVQLVDARVQTFELDRMETLPPALFDTAWDLLLLPNPNPPLGTLFPRDRIDRLAQGDGLLLIDEAYIDFAETSDHIALIASHPNVVISRTFSKSFGLAGLRVGYAVGHPDVIAVLGKLADSYNVNRISQEAAIAAIEAAPYYLELAARVRRDRQWLREQLIDRGFDVPISHGNFLFARHEDASGIYENLKRRGIYIRYFGGGIANGGVRVSIGVRRDLEALIEALDAMA